MNWWILLATIGIIGFFVYQKKKYVHRKDIAPKSFYDLPTIGKENFFFGFFAEIDWERGYHHCIYDACVKHGFFVRMTGPPGIQSVTIYDPEQIKEVMPYILQKSAIYEVAKPLIGNGLLISHGELWKKQRKSIEPAFHVENLKFSADITKTKLSKLMSTWEKSQTKSGTINLEIRKELQKLTLDVIGLIGFGYDFNAIDEMDEEGSLANNFDQLLNLLEKRVWALSRVSYWLPTTANSKFTKCMDSMEKFLQHTVENRIKSKSTSPDILNGMIQEAKQSNSPLNLQQMRDEAANFLFAGHDTTATTAAFALWLLSTHPDIQNQVFKEISEKVQEEFPSYESLAQLDTLDRVWKETLRLFPPAHFLGRKTDTDVNIGGYHIPPGIDLSLAAWVTHRHPKYWENPLEFDPDRFLPEKSKDRHPFAYIPFFLPPRNCIGMRLANVEGKLALAILIKKYEFSVTEGAPIVETASAVTLKPKNGIHLTLKLRK